MVVRSISLILVIPTDHTKTSRLAAAGSRRLHIPSGFPCSETYPMSCRPYSHQGLLGTEVNGILPSADGLDLPTAWLCPPPFPAGNYTGHNYFVCMCVCLYVCMCICVYVYMCICVYVYMCVFVYVCMFCPCPCPCTINIVM